MTETFTRTVQENTRKDGKSEEENMRGISVRLAKARETNPELTVDDIGTDNFPLRAGENRDATIDGVTKNVAKMAKLTIGKDSPDKVIEEPITPTKRELSPEMAEKILKTLKERFEQNMHLHEGVKWSDVEAALKKNPEVLWSVNQMQKQGHDPDVYDADDEGCDIGTCSKETPVSGRNCVYDAEAAELLKKTDPDAIFKGSAVEQAGAMGIRLMLFDKYRDVLQQKGKFDKETWSFLFTPENVRKAGAALLGGRDGDSVRVYQDNADSHYGYGAWRGSLRVLWA